jgi:hypothetical protein
MMALQHTAFFMRGSFQAEAYGGRPVQLMSWPHWVSGLLVDLNAPTFWLLVGVSVPLMVASRRRAGDSEHAITLAMLKKAGVLAVLDLTICDWAWRLADPIVPYTHVLLSISLCLALVSVLRLLPHALFALLFLSLLVVYQWQLTRWVDAWSETPSLWVALLVGYQTARWPAIEFALAGWLPVVGIGYLLGHRLAAGSLRRPQEWLRVGFLLMAAWAVFRAMGGFGDLVPYRPGDEWYRALIMNKTPLALTYLLFYLGVASFVLAGLLTAERRMERAPLAWLVVLGRASLFVFVAHIAVYSVLSRAARTIEWGVPRVAVSYGVFLAGMIVLVPMARWYSGWRRRLPHSALLP